MSSAKNKAISTVKQLENLPIKDKPYDVKFRDISGLTVRVSTKGVKSFRWDRGSKNTPRIITYGQFGQHPTLTLKDARTLHEEKQQQHKAGTIGVMNTNTPKTVADLAELYYLNKKTTLTRPDAIRQVLDKDIIPTIGGLKLNAVTTLMVRGVIDKVINRGAKSHAGKVLSIVKSMFNFALANGLLTVNPAAPLTKDAMGVINNPRNRTISCEELKIFWDILEKNNSLVTRIALQLLTLLGSRTGELRLSKWESLDTNNKTLTIPPDNQKLLPKQRAKAKPFVIPLDKFSMSLFEKLRGLDDIYIFVGSEPNKPLSDKALGRYTNRTLKSNQLEPFTPHDLRRTFRTGLSELGIQPHIAERCLNHSLGKILETYDQHDFLNDRRVALSLWSNHVQGCIS